LRKKRSVARTWSGQAGGRDRAGRAVASKGRDKRLEKAAFTKTKNKNQNH
jgi:hypothetical protein